MASWRDNAKVVEWVRDYYKTMKWGDVDFSDTSAVGDAGTELEARRRSALAALKNLAVGAELTPGNRRTYVKDRKHLVDRIHAATDVDAFDALDGDIGELRDRLDTQIATANARIKAQAALDAAVEKRDASIDVIDEGGYRFLATQIKDMRARISGSTIKDEFDAEAKSATDLLTRIDDAVECGKAVFDWNRSASAYIETSVDEADRANARARQYTVKAEVTNLSKQGNFKDAVKKLDAFKADPLVDAAALESSAEFFILYAEFRKKYQSLCEAVVNAGKGGRIKDVTKYEDNYREAKALAFTDGKFKEAAKKLQDLRSWCEPRRKVAKTLAKIDGKLSREKTFRDNVLKPMNDELDAGRFTAARNILIRFSKGEDKDGANPEMKRLADMNFSYLVDGRLEARKTALEIQIPELEKSQLNAAWTAHKSALAETPPNHAEATTQAGVLRNLFQFEGIIEARKEIERIKASGLDASSYDYLDEYQTSRTAKDFVKARADIEAAIPLYRNLMPFLDQMAEATKVLDAFPTDPPELRAGLTQAIDDANVLALAKDPVGALQALRIGLSEPESLTLSQEIADYETLLTKVEKEHALVLKLLGASGPVSALNTALAEAKAHVTSSGAYDLAYDALTVHQNALPDAKTFGAERRQAISIRAALLRATKDAAVKSTVFGATGEAEMEAAFKTADDHATAGRFGEAIKAFKAFAAKCEAYCTACADHYEKADGDAGSNAGHSIGRHGPGITSEKLIERLTTGIAPDGISSPTPASSKFKSMQDWIAGREMAAAAALDAGIDIEAKSVGPPFVADLDNIPPILASPSQKGFIVEHGKAIDEAFHGREAATNYVGTTVTKKMEEDPVGSGTMVEKVITTEVNDFVQGSTYESYEEMSGLTRAYVNFMFECEPIDVFDSKSGTTKTHTPNDVEAYVKLYRKNKSELGEAVTDPPNVPGRWVMMQQYPVVDGWDDTTKSYKTDPPDMIP